MGGSVTGVETPADKTMTIVQAYEAAFRFVFQYYEREAPSEPLELMLVAMEPAADYARTNDPASWSDWEQCVAATLRGDPLPGFEGTNTGPSRHLCANSPHDFLTLTWSR